MKKPNPTRSPAALRPLALALACLLSPWLAAQSASESKEEWKDWYQVEMIVFAHTGKEAGEEVWRADLDLAYPQRWLELLTPAELAEKLERDAAAQREDEPQADNGTASAVSPNSPGAGSSKPGPPLSDPSVEAAEAIGPKQALEHRALLLLPSGKLTLPDQARRLSRSNDYRILFHGAWLQPLAENRNEAGILIRGGEQYDEHRELEGSIKLYRRTYLHVETNLWLARFANNPGLQGMGLPGRGLQGTGSQGTDRQDRGFPRNAVAREDRESAARGRGETSANQARAGQAAAPISKTWPKLPFPPNRPPKLSDFIPITEAATGLWFDEGSSEQYATILAEPYVVENLVQLQQGRRMRSTELHYIDHPKMGLLIQITPYEPPAGEGDANSGNASRSGNSNSVRRP